VSARANRGVWVRRSLDDGGTRVSATGALLIVDAHADGAESLQLLLETLGYTVHVALDGASAIAVAERHVIALALVGIDLPDCDGYGLASRLRACRPDIALVAFTGYGHAEDRRRAIEAGFDDHLLKPATVEQLEAVLTRLLARRD
jgi:two-component system, sensor histidine kinase